jgi:hypothetical protein
MIRVVSIPRRDVRWASAPEIARQYPSSKDEVVGKIALADLEATSAVNVEAIERYALSMQAPRGGFFGFSLDQIADVEYSFYGIAAISLCRSLP